MNACKWNRLETYQVKENLKKLEKNHLGRGLEWERWCLGEEQVQTGRERSKKWEPDHEERIYRSSVILDR